ncbi:hypothetical protein BF492_005174 [Escherichia coli]|nr:hypothetical protein [Escherichia coli]EGH9955214.1 hypothetical protein [Escherichia coli]
MNLITPKWEKLLHDLIGLLIFELEDNNISDSHMIAGRTLICMAPRFQGRSYLPKGNMLTTIRDDLMYSQLNGGSTIRELAIEHDLSNVQVYQIIAKQRACRGALI